MAKRKRKQKETELVAPSDTKRITPVDIQQREFRVALRGYHEQDVDQFLDEVTEEVARLYAENKRLREDLEFARTTHMGVGAAAEANALLLEAREEAARILADARIQLAGPRQGDQGDSVTTGGAAALGPFISRERRFLQGLADLIQSHAEAVKRDLRRARPSAPGHGPDRESREPPSSETSGPLEAAAPSPATGDQTEERAGEEGAPEDSAAEVKEGGSEWTRYYVAPTAAETSQGAVAEEEEIVDLTRASDPPQGEAIRGDAEGTPNPSQAEPLEEDDTDRSLRELFWGED